MSGKLETQASRFDILKWLLVIILLIGGIIASTFYASQPMAIRLAGWLVLGCIVLLIAAQTAQGKRVWGFTKDARIELRKVVWPNRQETVQSTMVVIMMVVITALFLWGIDSFLLWLVSLLTGQKG